ncbi:mechanosensitive ion channel family protein [Candidatus Woesearchaeota archaeon]|nr:mechanosensitive ion channel family protein [Candidatus Woesearchaeota archaeon]
MGGEWFFVRDVVMGNQWLYAAVILAVTIILARTLIHVIEGLIKLYHKRAKTYNQKLLAVIETPAIIIVALVGVELVVRNIIIGREGLSNALLTGFIVVLTYLLIRIGCIILEHWSAKMSQEKGAEFHSEVLPLMKSVITLVLSLLGIVLSLQVWAVDIPTVLTSLGVVSVILGFAFQQTLGNIFGGISLIMDNSFRKGDLIQIEDGDIGEVMEINLRSTKIKNFDQEAIIIPNGQLSNSKIINLAQPTPTTRIKIPVSVAYGSDPLRVKEVLHGSLQHHPDILKMPKRLVRFVSLGESSIDFELYFYINDYKKLWSIRDEVLTQVYKDLYEHGIEIPFPIRTIVQARPRQYGQRWKVKNSQEKRAKKR